MSLSSKIQAVRARQVLDSRGRPTVEADVRLQDGSLGRASAPSGASTGRYEAWELRDREAGDYGGLGVRMAVANVNGEIARAIVGVDAREQKVLDDLMRDLDGTAPLMRLGANAILAVSMAAARAAAAHHGVPLFRYIAELAGAAISLPMPMTNILSGGAHAGRGMDLQDFLVAPIGAQTYSEALSMISRVRTAAADLMHAEGRTTLLADEGGLSPGYGRADEALDLMMRSFEAAGLRPGADAAIALDVAASELFSDGRYLLRGEGLELDGPEMAAFIAGLARRYPILSIEDALDQDDWDNWSAFTRSLPDVQIVGDDLFVTNAERIELGVRRQAANAALIKLNQNGTLTGALSAVAVCRAASYATVVSARSGETEDSFIADLAVGIGAGQIKIGSVRNSERLAKYNQLLRIEEEAAAPFAGLSGFRARREALAEPGLSA
ncbi:MAG TPA: phosphopyruvate hydratase [Phenylobacterium sp.]|uniref:phosphopyruvate hydratase n=1 Tax=Phenylobacterium sp. TaxID=1871053 RepID=UPI002B45DCF9|nr:phosphopyruvate hydratase [Phenylobacterium sp.]HKR87848.1 phosphopyruvate hydratase [Phenylobacterium sp.]